MSIVFPFFLFFTHFAFGLLLVSQFVSMREVRKSFFRFNGFICLIALLAATLILRLGYGGLSQIWLSELYKYWVLPILLVLVYFLALRTQRIRLTKALLYLSVLAGVLVIGADAALTVRRISTQESFLIPVFYLNYLASALLLGSVTAAMILGHWYLVDPRLSISHLKKLAVLFNMALLIRAFFVSLTLIVYSARGADPPYNLSQFLDPMSDGLFFWMRVLTGLVGPTVLAFLIWRTVKMRSTQSATGLLYVAVILVLFGELIAKYLSVTALIPV